MNRLSPTLALVLGLLLGSLLTYGGLHLSGRLAPPPPPRPELLMTLGQTLDAEHHRVDLLLDKGDVVGAIGGLEELRGATWPSPEEAGETVVVLRHDLYGRLLRLRIDNPETDPRSPEELLAIADEGLGTGFAVGDVESNAFTARLLGIRGELLEQLGRDDEALGAYEQALDINRALLQDALGQEGS